MAVERLPDNLQEPLACRDREIVDSRRLQQRSLMRLENEVIVWNRIAQIIVITYFLLVVTGFFFVLGRNNLSLLTILEAFISSGASALLLPIVNRIFNHVNTMLERQAKERLLLFGQECIGTTTSLASHNNEETQKESVSMIIERPLSVPEEVQDLAQTQAAQQTMQKSRVVPQRSFIARSLVIMTSLGIISMLLSKSTRKKIANLINQNPPLPA